MNNVLRIFLALIVIAAVQGVYYYPRLPDLMASRFGGDGHANGWSIHQGCFLRHVFGDVDHDNSVIRRAAGPAEARPNLVSLPNKDYWLAPERRAATFSKIGEMPTMGIATVILMILVIQRVILANLTLRPFLDPVVIWLLLAAYFAFTVGRLLRFVLWFRRPKDSVRT